MTGGLQGFTSVTMRALELHEANAHARGSRRVADLGDAILLHDPLDRDPFVNRLSALRLPDDHDAFDRRLAELLALFSGLGRRAHAWLSPAFGTPDDVASRLRADGFVDVGGTYAMIRVRPALARPGREAARVERLADTSAGRAAFVETVAMVLLDAFGADTDTSERVADDLDRSVAPASDVCLVRAADGEPVAAGRRFTADGATYISSIGTRPAYREQGFASVVTSALVDDGIDAGGPLVHLGVECENEPAQRVYRHLGFEIVGGRQADLLLT
jgi:ribosomal protein S18 acetylase RimI-like enzyme